MVTFTGAPLGGFVGGQIVALLLHLGFAWPIIFVDRRRVPARALDPVMALWLPESPRFLAAKAQPRRRAIMRLLQRLDITPEPGAGTVDLAQGNPIKMLFGEGYALQTVLLWIIFFCSLLNLFLFVFWLPEILHLTGMTPAAGGVRDEPAALRRDLRGALSRRSDRPLGPRAGAGAAFCRRHRVHRADRAGGVALPGPAAGGLPLRHDDHRQPDRRQRGLRRALPGADAHQRHRLGARHRPAGRHRRGAARRLSVVARVAADACVLERLSVRGDRRGGDGVAGLARGEPGQRAAAGGSHHESLRLRPVGLRRQSRPSEGAASPELPYPLAKRHFDADDRGAHL